MALENMFYSCGGLKGIDVLSVVLVTVVGGYRKREELSVVRRHLRVKAAGEDQAQLIDQNDG